MRLSKRSHRGGLDINMTPMIDVTFLLLIFFMTVNQVSKTNRENIPLPPAKGSQDQTEGALVININLAGEIIISGNAISLPELVSVVSEELGRLNADPTRLKVVLRADRQGTSRTVNDVVKLLERLNVRSVRLAVESNR